MDVALHFSLLMSVLLLIVRGEPHSLEFHFTTLSPPSLGQPHYLVYGYVNGIQVVRYTNGMDRVQPLFRLKEAELDTERWENLTRIAQYYEIRQQQIIQELKKSPLQIQGRRNQYIFQVKFMCFLSEDDNFNGYEEFAVNGKEFIVLDAFIPEFVSIVPAAKMMVQNWNNRKFSAQRQRSYLENECVVFLKNYLPYVKDYRMPVPPQVKVSSQQSDGLTVNLHCWVYGFYPKDVSVTWMKNHEEKIPTIEPELVLLPNPDGTFQTRVSVEVSAGEGASYSCHVHHIGLEEAFVGIQESKMIQMTPVHWHFGLYAVLVVIGFVSVAICAVTYRKKSACTPRLEAEQTEDQNRITSSQNHLLDL